MFQSDLSVIIISYNTLAYLQRAIRCVAAGFRRYSTEIIVVDNGSSDGSREWLQSQSHLRNIFNSSNVGFAVANNQAISVREGRHCLLLNSDAFMHPSCGDIMLDFLHTHPQAGLVVPTFEYENGVWQPSCGAIPSLRKALGLLLGWQTVTHAYYRWRDRVPIVLAPKRQGYGEGAGLLIRDRVLQCIGSLSPSYFFYAEDVEYCLRAAQNGWQTWWVPAARLTHVRGGSLSQKDFSTSAELQMLGLTRFICDHYTPTEARAAFVVQFLHHLKLVLLGAFLSRLPGIGQKLEKRLPLYLINYRLYRKHLQAHSYARLVRHACSEHPLE